MLLGKTSDEVEPPQSVNLLEQNSGIMMMDDETVPISDETVPISDDEIVPISDDETVPISYNELVLSPTQPGQSLEEEEGMLHIFYETNITPPSQQSLWDSPRVKSRESINKYYLI